MGHGEMAANIAMVCSGAADCVWAGAPTVVLPGKFLLSNPSWMPGEWASNHQRWNCVCSPKLWDSRFESQWLPQHWDLMVPIPWLSGLLPLCTLTHTCVRWWHPWVRNAQETLPALRTGSCEWFQAPAAIYNLKQNWSWIVHFQWDKNAPKVNLNPALLAAGKNVNVRPL